MLSRISPRRACVLACLPLLGLSACGNAVSTSKFSGEEHEVAQVVANLQSDATAGEQGKICSRDLAPAVVSRLGGLKGCEEAIKRQVSEIDNPEATVSAVQVHPGGAAATATVSSIYEGKKRSATVSLVKQNGTWKVAALQ